MEFTNYEREFMKALTPHTVEELLRIKTVWAAYRVESFQHTMDNYTMDSYFGKVLDKMKNLGYTFLGVGNAPYTHGGRSMAVVFEDANFEKYWYHVDAHIVEWWQEQVELFLGERKFE